MHMHDMPPCVFIFAGWQQKKVTKRILQLLGKLYDMTAAEASRTKKAGVAINASGRILRAHRNCLRFCYQHDRDAIAHR